MSAPIREGMTVSDALRAASVSDEAACRVIALLVQERDTALLQAAVAVDDRRQLTLDLREALEAASRYWDCLHTLLGLAASWQIAQEALCPVHADVMADHWRPDVCPAHPRAANPWAELLRRLS